MGNTGKNHKRSLRADDPDYIRIKKMVEKYDKKQKIVKAIKEKINRRKLAKEQQGQLYYQFLKLFKCIKSEDEENDKIKESENSGSPETQEFEQQAKREFKLMKLLNTSSEAQNKIRFA